MKRKFNNILILLILTHVQVWAQLPHSCDIGNYKTNPLSPIDLRGQPYINEITPGVPKFDWIKGEFDYYRLAQHSTSTYILDAMINPFWQNQFSNIYHLAHPNDESFRDNRPEDGWELLTFAFGSEFEVDANNELQEKIVNDENPYFILYNKFTGVIRIFVLFVKQPNHGYQTGYIRIHQENKIGNRAALFQHFEVNTQPLVSYDANVDQEGTVVNGGITQAAGGQWMYADFAMSYDACVCEFEYSDILFDAYMIDDAQISMDGFLTLNTQGNIFLNINAKVDNGGVSNNPYFQTFGKAAKAGQTAYKSVESAIPLLLGIAAIVASKGTLAPLVIAKLAESKALKNAPYIAGAIGIIDFLVGGSKKTTITGTAKGEVVLTTTGEISLNGSISKKHKLFKDRRLHVPGSKLPASPQVYHVMPKYNEPLGVFMMLEPPLIKYVEYRDNMSSNVPRVRQYKVDELPIFKLNPSSGLEIEEMKVSLVLDYGVQYNNVPGEFNVNTLNFTKDHNHPVIFSESPPLPGYQADPYIEYEKMGFNLEKEFLSSGGSPESVRLTLGQIPIGCFENTSFYLSKEATSSEELVLKIRFNLILKEKLTGMLHQAIHIYNIPSSYIIYDEEHDDNHEFLYYATLEPESWGFETRRIIPFYNSVFSSPNSSLPSVPSYYQEKNTNILDYLIWEDEIVPEGTYKAWELISIGNNVTLQGNSSFYSYGEIFITPENQFTPDKKFSTIFPDAGCYDNPMDYNTEDVSSFCIGPIAKYDPVRNIMEPDLDLDTTPIVKTFDFKLYPNPTSRIVNVELPEMAEGGVYDITVMDIRGQVMSEMRILPSETVGSVYEMEVSHLTAGIYFVRLVIDGEAKVKRLVIL